VSVSLPATDLVLDRAIAHAVDAALVHLATSQSESGSWKGDYGGPLFLLPLYIVAANATGVDLDDATRGEMTRYLEGHQNRDGGFGLHVEGESSCFSSVLNYVALRTLGREASHRGLVRARDWFLAHGGALASASWGKFILCLLGLYSYEGIHPIPPELWLLPRALPFHPSRLWCHCRMVYLPMSYAYGARLRAPESALTRALRGEIYDMPYERIDWRTCRDRVSPTDSYVPHSSLLRAAHAALDVYERRVNRRIRRRALEHVLDQIRREDRNTQYLCIGPISKLLHTWIWHFRDPRGPEFAAHVRALPAYLWRGRDGIKVQGYNSSELWDTAFAVQAVVASGRAEAFRSTLRRAGRFIEEAQVVDEVEAPTLCYRRRSRGGWPFSTRAHGWPISDCTAEAITASLIGASLFERPLPEARLVQGVEFLLSLQNADGGFPTYERAAAPAWLELLNPSDCFADVMVDVSYVECTSAALSALDAFGTRHPGILSREIARARDRAIDFILRRQRRDGSWVGSWGICFTYGTWFGVRGLMAAGFSPSHAALRAAADFLVDKQLPDGGWGETAESCVRQHYVSTSSGQAVMTSWALLALLALGQRRTPAVRRGLSFLVHRQRPDGSWPDERIAGVFNRTCAIHYDNYLKVFPLWTLSQAR